MQNIIRETDVFARWGGEEFVVLMRETNVDHAFETAEKIRRATERIIHPGIGTVTISIGVAEHIKGEDLESWFKRADKELYRAKKEGRNWACS